MSEIRVRRTECDRCGHMWEGTEKGSLRVIVQDGETTVNLFGMMEISYAGHTFPQWNALCADCAGALLPWLGVKK